MSNSNQVIRGPVPIFHDPLGILAIAYAVFHYGWFWPQMLSFFLGLG
ncbi:hypothetical protein [Profundibacter sp.]